LLSVINNILDFSKIDGGMMELEHSPFDLRRCIESTMDLMVTRAAEKGLVLKVVLDDQLPTMLVGDASRLRQVLANLLSFASMCWILALACPRISWTACSCRSVRSIHQ
jgi:signal transduction histidine kinase